MRILFADSFHAPSLAQIEAAGHECEVRPDLTAEMLPEEIAGHDVLVVRSTRVSPETLAAGDRLRLVIRAGAGTNTIARDAAAQHGIAVSNVPGRNAIAVAELAFALMSCLDRDIPDAVADLRAGRWDKARYGKARGLHGRRVGVVGLGDIGLAFAERAAAFGMEVHAVAKRDRDPATAGRATAIGVRFVEDLPTLAATCDILSFHVPATPGTVGLVGRELLGHCRDGTWIINTSRGEIVDEEALLEALDSRGMRAGLDVFADEPAGGTGVFSSALGRHPRVYGTHHIGASTEQAQRAIAQEVVVMLEAFDSGTTLHCVNAEALAGQDRIGSSSQTTATHDGTEERVR